MEVAIANNQTTTTTTSTATANANNNQHHSLSGVRSPFQREVREWQRIDPATGALLTGRLEADRWINGPLHSYGKISDSQNISQPNGTHVSQKKQLEVLQQRTATGAMQVIRAQTVQSSSSRWSSSTATTSTRTAVLNGYSNNSESNNNFNHNSSSSSLFQNSHTHMNGNSHHYNYNDNTSSRLQPMLQAFARVNSNHDDHDLDDDDDDNDDHVVDNNVNVIVDEPDDDDDDDDYYKHFAMNEKHLNNGHKSHSHNSSNNFHSNDSSNNSSFSNFLLLDTAPSLKLSNLMKSSSSVSCNSNSSTANMQNFTSSNNSNNANNRGTHGSGSKVSLHAIVGSSNNSNDSKNGLNVATLLSTSSSATSSFNTAATAASTAWQRQQQQQIQSQQQQEPQQQPPHQQRHSRLFEQLPTFGKINFGTDFAKSRVGEAVAVADDRAEAKFDDRVTFNSTATTTTTTTDARNTLQLTPTHLQRRNLESFRHYNDDADDHHHHHHLHHYHNDDRGDYNIKNIDNYDDDDVNENNDADMRLSTRHQRRQQLPVSSSSFTNASLHRGRSISTDDLSTEWDPQSDDTTIDEPGEWKRVSKLRRSFQSPATTHLTTSDSTAPRRPLDLPASSVSVSKIRAELEQGRRLNTAMRNNNVDMAALQSILNPTTSSTTADIKPVPAQRSTFLTADSLKKIRNNLKKLSDESLYKEDFLQHQTAPVEHLEIHEVKTKPVLKTQLCRITPERTSEMNTTAPSAFKLVAAQKQSSPPAVSFNPTSKQHTTHSLESRQKYRDTSSAEWHLRRKSYGFEKMLPTEESNMFRMDASTDSGLGRSSELNAWSPTETAPAPRSTVVHFGESTRVTGLVQRRYQNQPNSPEAGSSSDDQKRHSIAFDDSQFVRKTSQVRINGIGQAELESSSQPQSYDTDSPTNGSSATQYFQRSQQKRVEFCKTEVHFAAESGRVNIVETDGKPPPTNNFRRRRRTTTSGPLQSLVKGASTTSETLTPEAKNSVALPITRFGDDNRPRTIASTTVAYKASLMDAKADTFEPSNVTITLPKIAEGLSAGSRNSYASTSGIDTTDNETDDIAGIRGILKNKPVKPKPYHLGENFETPDALWGVQLKPVGGQQLRKESVDTATTRDSPPLQALNKSVAERVHNVEKRQDLSSTVQQNGYSTKINLSLGENSPDWREQGLNGMSTHTTLHPNPPRPSTQQLILNELKEHQKILDEGLKSTSLIMKTMRSASEFDEAMRRLSIASMETSSIPPIVVPTPMLRSHSYQETAPIRSEHNSEVDGDKSTVVQSASYGSTATFAFNRRTSTEICDTSTSHAPIIAPRLRLIGKTQVPVSQQLSQLRRLYEAAAHKDEDSNDSADEEVKRYFPNHPENSDSGGGTQESSSLEDDRAFEYTTSWSRLKAKRTIWQIEADEARQATTKVRTDLPKSNIMSIALHSPQATMEKTQSQTAPIARPRTTTDSTTKEPLRIIKEARGARKLREHELSFFGVPIANSKASNTATQQTTITTTSTKRTLPQRPRFREETSNSTHNEVDHSNEVVLQSSKWKLTHDRPDLLHHTEHHSSGRAAKESHTKKKSFSPVKHIQYSDEDEDTETENFYENLTNDLDAMPQKTQSMQAIKGYSRQRDLARDERILSEMTHTADQTMKALNDEAVLKDQRRRSLTRRNSKPLETIDEKSISEKISDKCIAVTVTRSTLASEAKRQTSHASRQAALSSETHTKLCRTRTSSQSSVESGSRPRSRSLSSEREYEQANAKQSARSSTKQSRHTKPTSRSSSRDSQRSSQTLGSSGDELCRRDERLRAKTKRSSGSVLTKTSTTEKLRSSEHERKEREKTGERSQQRSSRSLRERPPTHRGESSSKSKSNSTTRSSQRECVECVTDVNRTPPPQPTTRRHRNESEKRSSSATRQAATVVNKLEARSSLRLVRSMRSSQDHDSSQRSSNRSERSGTEKEKLSRSRGHSSRSAAHSNDNSKLNHHHHHHQQQQHSSSPSSTSRTRSSSEHKKSASATAPSATADNSQTHSKNASALNGISSQRQHHHHDRHHHHHQQPAQHIHSLTAATIATKQRERSGKDRK